MERALDSKLPRLNWILIWSILLMLTFGIALATKLQKPMNLVDSITQAEFLDRTYSVGIAVSVLVAEALVVVLLAFSRTRLFGLYLTIGLSSAFGSFSLWRWHLDLHAPCSCFGIFLKLDPCYMVLMNLAIIVTTSFAVRNILNGELKS